MLIVKRFPRPARAAVAPQHHIQVRQQLAHAGGCGDFERLADGGETLSKPFDDRIESHAGEGRHVPLRNLDDDVPETAPLALVPYSG